MQKDIHPKNFREVAFRDVTSGQVFVIKSTVDTAEETIEYEGYKYPLFTVDTSSASHPVYTGGNSSAKATCRVEKFNKKFANFNKK